MKIELTFTLKVKGKVTISSVRDKSIPSQGECILGSRSVGIVSYGCFKLTKGQGFKKVGIDRRKELLSYNFRFLKFKFVHF